MTALDGTIFTSPSVLLTPELSIPLLWDKIPYSQELKRYSESEAKAKSNVEISIVPKTSFVGYFSNGLDQEFYGHILVWPRTLNLGLVLSAQSHNIGIWNITGYSQRLVDWTITGLDGVTVTNEDGYPVQFGTLAYRNYLVTVTTSGSAQITGSISFHFDGISLGTDVGIIGNRIVVFSFEPNWREPVVESLEWLTDVLTSHNDREQRMALRQDPRRAMKYLFTFESQNKVNNFHSLMWGWQQRVFAVPVWTDWQYLSANISAGTSTISVDTQIRDFAASRLVLLWRDYQTWEVVEVSTLTSSQINLVRSTINDWTTMDRIIPIRLARLAKDVKIQRPTSTIADATLTFTCEVGEAVDSHRLGTSTMLQYQSLDVLTLPPNVASGDPDESYSRDIDIIDHEKGYWYVNDHSDGPVVSRPYSWLLKTRQEIMNFMAFLETRKGKAIPFWMPTWSLDLEQTQNMGASDVNIVVKSIGYTRHVRAHSNRSVLIFYPANGSTPIVKSIVGSSESQGNTETITLNSSFGSIKTPADFKAISFLTYCRLDQDDFELTWHNDSVAEVSFRVREVLH